MKITAYYLDGVVEEYNTDNHYSSANLFGSANAGMVCYKLKMDKLERGLWVQYFYYDSGNTMSMEVKDMDGRGAQMVAGHMYPVLTGDELEKVAYVMCDDRRILWRNQPDAPLINGIKFEMQSEMLVGKDRKDSLNQQAIDMYRMLHGDGCKAIIEQLDYEDDEVYNARIAETMGWSWKELKKIIENDDENLKNQEKTESGEEGIVGFKGVAVEGETINEHGDVGPGSNIASEVPEIAESNSDATPFDDPMSPPDDDEDRAGDFDEEDEDYVPKGLSEYETDDPYTDYMGM